MTHLRTALAVLPLTAAAVLAGAAPGLAGSNDARTAYGFSWSAGGDVPGTLVSDERDGSPMGLLDYLDPTRTDVAWGTPVGAAEAVTVRAGDGTYACATDRTLYYSGLTVLGNTADWTRLPDGGSTTGRVRLNCTTTDGVVHHFHWGEHQVAPGKWSASPPTPNCVTITRSGPTFSVSAAGCVVQHEIVSTKPGKQLSTSNTTASFTATLTVGAALAGR